MLDDAYRPPARPTDLPLEQWAAFIEHHERMWRANRATPRDLPHLVGCAKELCESMAVIVLTTTGVRFTGKTSYRDRIGLAHEAIGLHPGSQLAGDAATRKVVGAIMNLSAGLGDLRNAFGTGHGRAEQPLTTEDHAAIAIDAATVWCEFMLRRLPRLLLGVVNPVIARLGEGTWFKGSLRSHLDAIDWSTISPSDARRLGIAVAHRTMRDTFMVRIEGVDAAIQSPQRFNDSYRAGLIEGFLISVDGTFTATEEGARFVVELARQTGALVPLLHELTGQIGDSEWREARWSPSSVWEVWTVLTNATIAGSDDVRNAWAELCNAIYHRHLSFLNEEPF